MSNLTGHSLGRYHILEQLGEGGMAIVYKAYDTRLESDVAVKVIRTERLSPEILQRALKRFEREAKSLAQLTHPNLVKVLDYGEYEGQPYLVMPYLPGGTLKEKMKGQPMPWQEATRLLIPIARALDYAHKRSLIHRDVKPSNILITESGEPMLTDFGVAKIIDEEATLDLTGTSAAVGTPEYMAPEQVVSKNVDHRADIYALGIVFYEMVTGRRPFQADTPMAVLFKHASEPLPRPSQFMTNLPDAVEKILLKALTKKPEDRYQSMGEVIHAMESLLSGVAPAKQQHAKPAQPARPREKTLDTQATINQDEEATVEDTTALDTYRTSTQSAKRSPAPSGILRYWPLAVGGGLVICILLIGLIVPPDPSVKLKVGQVTDLGGIDDKSFNASAWKGAEDAITDLGIEAKYLESQQQSDYAKNVQQYLDEGTDLIVTVGFLLGVDTAKFAIANPDQKFAIVDYAYPDCWPGANVGVDCGTDQDLANVRGLMFQTDQAAFLAGYLAAGMTQTDKVATYGGLPIPTVTIFMKGFEAGVKYYNEQKGAEVEVLGWNSATSEGVFANGFESTDDGRQLATSFMEEGADIILPVAGQVGLGSAAVCKETGACMVIGVDADWVETAPEYKEVVLTSVLKLIDVAVYNTIKDMVDGKFTGGTVTYTIADGGVDIAPFHEFDGSVSAELKSELEAIKAALIDGSLTVDGVLADY